LNSPTQILVDAPKDNDKALLFQSPREEIRADSPEDVPGALERIERALASGSYVAGFLAYELGYQFERRLVRHHQSAELPLVWCFVFDRPQTVKWNDVIASPSATNQIEVSKPRPVLSRNAYKEKFDRVRAYLEAGDCYQINLTFPLEFNVSGDPLALFATLRQNTRAKHTAYLSLPGVNILSLSPELFIECNGQQITTRPMKGTAPRGMTTKDDQGVCADLRKDPKTLAENMMIVDLIRNDLGRLCETGSINVSDLFAIETYPTLHQMTSSISGSLRPGISVAELLAAMFPCGSVTGAPKIRAMEIIRELEDEPRGVYTGSIGYFSPDRKFNLNVSIRTITIDDAGKARMGIGSGLVYDSNINDEYDECLLKAAFLTEERQDFGLIETFRWEPSVGYHFLSEHLARLASSANHLDFCYDETAVLKKLNEATSNWSDSDRRVRLVLSRNGDITITSTPLGSLLPMRPFDFALSRRPVSSRDRYLYHKTTLRDFFAFELESAKAKYGCDEVVFVNERGEVTEGSYTNIFVQKNGRLVTPPQSSGLLNGCLRQSLLTGSEKEVVEGVLYPCDLDEAEAIFLGNSVRGLMPARKVNGRSEIAAVPELAAHG